VHADRLSRLDRGPGDVRHTDRTRSALDRESQPIAGPTHARAEASDDGRHGRHAIRDDRGGGPRLLRHRRRNSLEGRRSVCSREHGRPVRLRRLLPGSSAIVTSRAARTRYVGRYAGARNGRLRRTLGPGCATLERTVALILWQLLYTSTRIASNLSSGMGEPSPFRASM
jgi:hypothetical protein